MSKFLNDLCLRDLTDSKWALTCDLQYQSDLLKCVVTIPSGFITDLASVPRVPILFPLWGDRAHYESVVHDYLYCVDSIPTVSESDANSVFLEAMEVRGKSWGIRYPMYWGVCIGGFTRFHKKTADYYKPLTQGEVK